MKKVKEKPIEVRTEAVWREVQKAVTTLYGCLVPQGEVTVQVVMSWTKEELLGVLKRSGRILSWNIEKGWEDGNNRKYVVILDTSQM